MSPANGHSSLGTWGLIAFVALAAFLNATQNDFVWDDPLILTPVWDLESPLDCFSTSFWNDNHPTPRQAYRPIRNLTLALDARLWGRDPAGYHITPFLLHVLNSVLAAVFARMLTRSRVVGVVTGLLFAVHPIHSEAVTYIKNRADPLACALLLVALIPYMRNTLTRRVPVVSFLAFVLAMLSKLSAVSFPLLLGAVLFVRHRGRWIGRIVLHVGVFLALSFALLGMRAMLLDAGRKWTGELTDLTSIGRAYVILRTYGSYFAQLPFPVHLRADRMLLSPRPPILPKVLWMFGVASMAGLALEWARRRWPYAVLSVVWVVFALVPVSNLKLLEGRPVAEQRTYVASIGFCLLIALAVRRDVIRRGPQRAAALRLAAGIALCFFAFTTQQNFTWATEVSLWKNAVRKEWLMARPHNNMGAAYAQQGFLKRAKGEFGKAILISPIYARAHHNMADLHRELGDIDEALRHVREAIKHDPRMFDTWTNLSNILAIKKQYGEAEEAIRNAVRLAPDSAMVYNNLASIQWLTGRRQAAVASLRVAVKLEPGSPKYAYHLGNVLRKTGRAEEAMTWYSRALRLNPRHSDALFRMGEVWESWGDRDKAEMLFLGVLDLDPGDWRAREGLAKLCEQRGKMDEARAHRDQARRTRAAKTVEESPYLKGEGIQ